MPRLALPLFGLFLGACSHAQPAPLTSVAQDLPAHARQGDRYLGANATFADLVHAISLLDGTETTAEACLMGKTRDAGYRLAGEIAPGLKPLPAPALDLDEALQAARSVQVLTPWGAYGNHPDALSFVSLTAFPPLRNAIVLALTERGMTLRSTDSAGTLQAALAPEAKNLAALGSLDGIVVFVAAEAQIPLSQIYDLLGELSRLGARASLAVNLTPGTPLPASAAESSARRCPDGLSETELPEADLPLDALLSAVNPLRERAHECLLRGGASGAAGGKLTLAFRVNALGHVQESCVRADEIGDARVATCLLDLMSKLQFPVPQPAGGVLDAELPLMLRPHSAPAQAPVCSDTES